MQYFSSTMLNRWLERFWNKEKKFNKWKRQRDKYLLWTQIFSVWRLWVRPDCPVYINFAFFCHHCLKKIFFLPFLTFLQQSTRKHMILRFLEAGQNNENYTYSNWQLVRFFLKAGQIFSRLFRFFSLMLVRLFLTAGQFFLRLFRFVFFKAGQICLTAGQFFSQGW